MAARGRMAHDAISPHRRRVAARRLAAVLDPTRQRPDAAARGVHDRRGPRVGARALLRRLAGCASGRVAGSARAGCSARRCASATRACCSSASDDGALHAFANVCRHRGHELLPCGATAKRAAIHCPYHAWTYDARRLAARDAALRRRRRASTRPSTVSFALRVEEWDGWVMVNVSGDARPLAEHIGALDELRRDLRMRRRSSSARRTSTRWRRTGSSPIENYHECYHCPAIHPGAVPW